MIRSRESGHVAGLAVAFVLFAALLAAPATALPSDGALETDWAESLPVMTVSMSERVPSGVVVVGDVAHVATGSQISRRTASTGAALPAWNAPAGVALVDVEAGPSGTLVAVGVSGDNGWIGRYSGVGALQWSDTLSGASSLAPVGIEIVGTTAYIAGNAGTAFDRKVFARRYDHIGGTPTMAWETVDSAGFGDSAGDVTATSSAVHVGGSKDGAYSSPGVWRFAATNGALTTMTLNTVGGQYLSSRVTGIDAEGDRLYVSWRGNAQTAIGNEVDGGVARLDADTLMMEWNEQIGSTFTPGAPPVLGDYDVAHDVAIDGSAVIAVGAFDGAGSQIAGLAATGGFLARFTDNGTSATRQYLRTGPVLGAVTVIDGDAFVTTSAPESYTTASTGGACAAAPGTGCRLARISGSTTAPPPTGFTDVPGSAYYAEAVAWLKQQGITTGTSPTTFSPDDGVTRGQMAAFLFRLAGEPGGSPAHGFSDVPGGAFYADAVRWLKASGITTGTSPTTFSPADTVTRGQMAAFLYRYAQQAS